MEIQQMMITTKQILRAVIRKLQVATQRQRLIITMGKQTPQHQQQRTQPLLMGVPYL